MYFRGPGSGGVSVRAGVGLRGLWAREKLHPPSSFCVFCFVFESNALRVWVCHNKFSDCKVKPAACVRSTNAPVVVFFGWGKGELFQDVGGERAVFMVACGVQRKIPCALCHDCCEQSSCQQIDTPTLLWSLPPPQSGASNVSLAGESPTCSVQAVEDAMVFLWPYDYGRA